MFPRPMESVQRGGYDEVETGEQPIPDDPGLPSIGGHLSAEATQDGVVHRATEKQARKKQAKLRGVHLDLERHRRRCDSGMAIQARSASHATNT